MVESGVYNLNSFAVARRTHAVVDSHTDRGRIEIFDLARDRVTTIEWASNAGQLRNAVACPHMRRAMKRWCTCLRPNQRHCRYFPGGRGT